MGRIETGQLRHLSYLKLIGPGAPLRLTTDPAHDSNPAWSPDGRSIAFIRIFSNRPSAVMLIAALGGSERKLAEGEIDFVTWSADGRWLAVSRKVPPTQATALYALSAATGEFHALAQPPASAWSGDSEPAFSPDGRTLAFARAMTRLNSEIYLLRVSESMEAKGQPWQLTFENRACVHPAWTADGKEVVFSSGRPGAAATAALWRIPANASAHTKPSRIPLTEGRNRPRFRGRAGWCFPAP